MDLIDLRSVNIIIKILKLFKVVSGKMNMIRVWRSVDDGVDLNDWMMNVFFKVFIYGYVCKVFSNSKILVFEY